jgi:hypothetical protein
MTKKQVIFLLVACEAIPILVYVVKTLQAH